MSHVHHQDKLYWHVREFIIWKYFESMRIKKRTRSKPFKKGNKFKNQYKHRNRGAYTVR